VKLLYDARVKEKGLLEFAFRGSWKTTTLSVTFNAWLIGKEPHGSKLIVSSNDDSAEKITASIARIIEWNPWWKVVFPHVVPDKEKGWGALGYEVKRTDMDYEQWSTLESARQDPSFLGIGIGSSRLPGKHPTRALNLDDIHDEKNSISDKERAMVIKVVSDTIFPMMVEVKGKLKTRLFVVGTPWHDDDAYHYMKSTGELMFHETPFMRGAAEGDAGAVYIDGQAEEGVVHKDIIGWWKMGWPEQHNAKSAMRWRSLSGYRGFNRMYLLNLVKAQETGMKYQLFDHMAVQYDWVTAGGVDFASIRSRTADTKDRDYFAMCYIALVPTGGAVIIGGVVGHKTQAGGIEEIEKAQMTFPNWHGTKIEDIGKGETFIDTILLKPHLIIIPGQEGLRNIPKHLRQERILSTPLEMGIVRISDRDDPYLNLLRKALDDYPDGNDDVRDAALWAVLMFPQLKSPMAEYDHYVKKEKKFNPFATLGR
jgi:hypothetical protein